jgi:2-oxoglutarate decarboxylase
VSTAGTASQFGPNEWLVEEMYTRFLEDPNSVDPVWHDFFADYAPARGGNGTGSVATVVQRRSPDRGRIHAVHEQRRRLERGCTRQAGLGAAGDRVDPATTSDRTAATTGG